MGAVSFLISALGFLLLWHDIRHWKEKLNEKKLFSELLVVLLFFFHAFRVLNLFSNPPSEIKQNLSIMLFSIFFLEFLILFGGNIFPNLVKLWKNPNYRQDHTYVNFLQERSKKNSELSKKQRLLKDISRKALHILQFLGVVFIFWISVELYPYSLFNGLEPQEFRNFFFYLFASLFFIMMMIGDITRMENWRVLPKWAWKWYSVSLDYPRESWTINAATPILLANLIWTADLFPIQILFIAVWISCISDASAAMIGKYLGKHKLEKVGKFREKTWEGLIAGIISTIIGVGGILHFFPLNISFIGNILIVGGNVAVFIITDLFCDYLDDNLLNSIAGGLSSWLMISLFS